MKKVGLVLIVVVVIIGPTLGYFFWQNGFNFGLNENEPPVTEITAEINDEIIEIEETELEEINSILEQLVNEDQSLDEVETEVQEATIGRPIPSIRNSVKLYENAFIRFSYPSYIEFRDITLNFLSVWDNNLDSRIGTINIYNNVENLSLEDFVNRDNLTDYFSDSASRGLVFEDFMIPTAERAIKFPDFPEVEIADIYLVQFSGLVVLVKDFSEDKVVGEYLLKSMEKSR